MFSILLLVTAVGVALVPTIAWGQYCFHYFNLAVGTENTNSADTQEADAFDNLQPPGATTTNLVMAGDYGVASVTAGASYGAVQVAVRCSLNRPAAEPGNFVAYFAKSADNNFPAVCFYDFLKITSAALSAGTPVLIRLSSVYEGFITPVGVTVAPDDSFAGTQASASANLDSLTRSTAFFRFDHQ